MSNSPLSMRRLTQVAASFFILGLLAVGVWFAKNASTGKNHGELTQADLDLRNDSLYVKGSGELFNGLLIEDYSTGSRKLSISIRDGRANGLSHGWYENGQMEVEESFDNGVSNGIRIRWFANGTKKSQAKIIDGFIVGRFTRWYENGVKAAEAQMENGQPHGIAQAWYPSGALKSRVPYDNGEAGEAVYFPDDPALAQVGKSD